MKKTKPKLGPLGRYIRDRGRDRSLNKMIDLATEVWTERTRENFRRRVADAVAAKWTRAVIDWIDSNITVKELTEFFQENEL